MYDVKKLVSLFVIRLYIKKENSDKKKKCTSKERKKKIQCYNYSEKEIERELWICECMSENLLVANKTKQKRERTRKKN